MKWYDPLAETFPNMKQWHRILLVAIVAVSVAMGFYHIVLKGLFT